MRIAVRPMLLAGALSMAAACAAHRPMQPGGRCPASIEIDNRSADAVEVYVHRGVLIRLGTAAAWRTVHFAVPQGLLPGTSVHLVARTVGGGRPVRTDELRPQAGDRIRWKIVQPLNHSSITAVVQAGPTEACAP